MKDALDREIEISKNTDNEEKKHRGQHGLDCFGCKIHTIGFGRENIRAVPKK